MSAINRQIQAYAQELEAFIEEHKLPSEWFDHLDHIAFKAADSEDFDALVDTFHPLSEQISYVEMNGRKLAAARLLSHVTLGEFGDVGWVELMEPRPTRVGKDTVGLDHVEFYYPNFRLVQEALRGKSVSYQMEDENPHHSWVSIIMDGGQEIKLNDGMLKDIVADGIAKGEAKFFTKA